MADTKISALTALTSLAAGDEIPVADASDLSVTKAFTLTTLMAYLQSLGVPVVKRLGSTHSVTGVTGTAVTDLTVTLAAGTYVFRYFLINRSATATTGVGLGINFTGTAAVKAFIRYNVSTITTASNGLTEEESGAALVTGGVMNAWASKAYSTTAPTTMAEGVGATGADLLDIVEGVLIVTVSGNLELWHSSQIAATTTTIEVGSSLIVNQTA